MVFLGRDVKFRLKRNCALRRDFEGLSCGGHIFTDALHAKMEELDRADFVKRATI